MNHYQKLITKALVMSLLLSLIILTAVPVAGTSVQIATAPAISSFAPLKGASGASIVINGSNFSNTTAVSFGGSPAASFKINSKAKITAVVGSGSTGKIVVTTPEGMATSKSSFTFIPAPVISSFGPSAGIKNTRVIINGANLTGATSVKFGSTSASSFTVNSGTQITAAVGSGSTGAVSVATPGGTAVSETNFTYYATPQITTFSPKSAGIDTTVTVTGTNFLNVTSVVFGLTPAASFSIVSNTRITAVVGSGSTGKITIGNPGGSVTSSSKFTFVPAPAISSISPEVGTKSTRVVISGAHLDGATSVKFGGTKASSYTATSTKITAVVGSGTTGVVSVTTPGGTATSLQEFTYYFTPTITSFSPVKGGNGSVVIITGTNLNGAASVKFGSKAAKSFIVNSNTEISATVGSGSTGKIVVTTPGGSATSKSNFTFVAAPTVRSFTPASGQPGTSVTITGTNFSGATAVNFGGTAAKSFKVSSAATSITAVVGDGSTGKVSVTTPGGTAASTATFTYIAVPAISSFTPGSARTGDSVTITGTHFNGATAVKFGGTSAASFVVNSLTEIEAVVGGGSSGVISVTTPGGTADSADSFTYIPTPAIASFTPASAKTGDSVTITGNDFDGATGVSFGGTPAGSFVVNSNTEIVAVVGSGSSGIISVTTPHGTANSADVFTYFTAPSITSFTPASAKTGETVTISGANFNGATAVSFGGTSAASFTVTSNTEIAAVVGSGSSGVIGVTAPGGAASSTSTFTYVPFPAITSFTPASAKTGDTVTISGINFNGATAVKFGGTSAASFTVTSNSEIAAVVGSGSSGVIRVTTPSGSANSTDAFTYFAPPTIPSFTPASAKTGYSVTITGTHLSGATAVSFGGTPADSFTVSSSTRIDAVVGIGSSGKISVSTPGGTAQSSTDFTYREGGEITTVTLTDADLPAPPVSGMTFHFIAPSASDIGTAKIRITYSQLTWSVWLGVEDGKLWIYHLPDREAIDDHPSLVAFYDYLGIDEFTIKTADGKYWFTKMPEWLNVAKYDPDLEGMPGMPEMVSISSTAGQMVIRYKK